ncbi:MAG: hypothetical protein ABFS46_05500 [Myxococcota bacterium]
MTSPPCRSRRERGARVLLGAWLLGTALFGCTPEPRELALLGTPGPWPWVSGLVSHGDRLWLANSVKHEEHNSADLYSYDPRSGEFRYERHLFSQGIGRPVELDSLLFWPYEDSRFHLGIGHLVVTDGERWELRVIREARLKHLHGLIASQGRLLAAASWLSPRLLASADHGRSWDLLYGPPSPVGRVDRILRLAELSGSLYGVRVRGLRRGPHHLVHLGAEGPRVATGWPEGELRGVATAGGWLHAVVVEADGRGLWRTDGRVSERLGDGPPGVRDLAVDASGNLWALAAQRKGGAVWKQEPDGGWKLEAKVSGGLPQEIHLYGGHPYVAGRAAGGSGALWGPAPPAPPEPTLRPPKLLAQRSRAVVDWPEAGRALDAALADPRSYEEGARPLVELLLPLALAGPPQGFFSGRLDTSFPDGVADLLEGRGPAARWQDLGVWALLWAMTVSGTGPVPLEWLAEPWTQPPNDRQKYFDPLPAALEALAWVGQRDARTLGALVERLGSENDPDWLTGDVVGALAALTGERFGHDVAAWRGWWAGRNRAPPTE